MDTFRKPNELSFDGNVAGNWQRFETDFDIFLHAAHNDKDDKTKAYIFLNIIRSEAVKKSRSNNTLVNRFSRTCLISKFLPKFAKWCIIR